MFDGRIDSESPIRGGQNVPASEIRLAEEMQWEIIKLLRLPLTPYSTAHFGPKPRFRWYIVPAEDTQFTLHYRTHFGLVTSCGDIDLGQHWLR